MHPHYSILTYILWRGKEGPILPPTLLPFIEFSFLHKQDKTSVGGWLVSARGRECYAREAFLPLLSKARDGVLSCICMCTCPNAFWSPSKTARVGLHFPSLRVVLTLLSSPEFGLFSRARTWESLQSAKVRG